MKKALFIAIALLMVIGGTSLLFAGGEKEEETIKIAFFVSTLNNVFHQGQATAAKEYAMEKYGAEVYIFDGKSDGAVMTENI